MKIEFVNGIKIMHDRKLRPYATSIINKGVHYVSSSLPILSMATISLLPLNLIPDFLPFLLDLYT